jgi:NAD(P)-binding Rossmann-like domain
LHFAAHALKPWRMTSIETDYLIIGAGAVGLAFADTLLAETDAHITIVDRHGKPGGHWNDAYSFVALHQPSAFYGVNSLPLGSGLKDTVGVNAGMYELASGPEVSGYFDTVMRQKLLPSGRVNYFPMADYKGDGRFVSMLSGAETQVKVRRKTVDGTYYGTTVPSTHKPKFAVADGARLVTPNALPHLWKDAVPPTRFVIIGAGKTAMDVGVWLLGVGAAPESIQWVMPRDSWLLAREKVQPGIEFFEDTIGAQADQIEAFATSATVEELFDRLETIGLATRIYTDVTPTMMHYATISRGEIATLQRITNVIRGGHVRAVEEDGLAFDSGKVAVEPGALYIDCTASAVEKRPAVPIFQGDLIVPQLVRAPQPAFSAALVAFVEANYADDATKNELCATVPFPDGIEDFPATNIANITNQVRWSRDKKMRTWIRDSRLDGFGRVIAAADLTDVRQQEILAKIQTYGMPALMNLHKLAGRA